MEQRISRICWNTNNWRSPSGREGKSSSKTSYEFKNGFGHEEWLFDTSRLIDGAHYCFLEPIAKAESKYYGRTFDIMLYTINGESRERFWIGKITNAEVLNEEESENIKGIYLKNGWLQEMEKQLEAQNAVSSVLLKAPAIEIFNLRFTLENLHVFSPAELIEKPNPIYSISRYNFIRFNKKYFPDKKVAPSSYVDIKNYNGSLDEVSGTQRRLPTRPREIQDYRLHENICRKVVKELKKNYKVVGKETSLGYEGLRLDVVVRNFKEQIIVYEIKTYNSIFNSIRMALGQLLEYVYRPSVSRAKEMIIVSHLPDSTGEVRRYMEHLRKTLSINIYYQQYSLTEGKLMNKL